MPCIVNLLKQPPEVWLVRVGINAPLNHAPLNRIPSRTIPGVAFSGAQTKKGAGSFSKARHWATSPVSGMMARWRSLQSGFFGLVVLHS